MCKCTHTDNVQVNIPMLGGCYGSRLTCACGKKERISDVEESKREKRER